VSALDKKGQPGVVAELFPFSEYFADAPQPLFKSGASYAEDMEVRVVGWGRCTEDLPYKRCACDTLVCLSFYNNLLGKPPKPCWEAG
jgi:hypothetical protein